MRNPFAAIALTLVTAVAHPDPLTPGRHEMAFIASWDESEQPYNLFIPSAAASEQPVPLAVVLHGKGATWRSWFDATEICAWGEEQGYVVAAPHGRGDWFYRGPGETDVLDVIADVKARCAIDEDRVYLLGHSMGGWGAWYLGCTHPELFASIVPMAAFAPLDLLPNARYLYPLVIHGDGDKVVFPRYSREAVDRLQESQIENVFLEVRDRGHESALINQMLPMIADHLRGRRRVTAPARVTARARTPTQGRIHWLSILETGHFPHVAGIDGAIDGTTMRLRTNSVRRFAIHPDLSPLADAERFRVTVDHHEYDSPRLNPDEALLFHRVHRSWMMNRVPVGETAPPPPPSVGSVTVSADDLAQVLCAIMAEEMRVDAGLMNESLVAPEVRSPEITADDLLNLFLRDDDELHVATLFAGTVTEDADSWYPEPWGDLVVGPSLSDVDPSQLVRVVCPPLIADCLPVAAQPQRITLRELLLNRITRTGTLP